MDTRRQEARPVVGIDATERLGTRRERERRYRNGGIGAEQIARGLGWFGVGLGLFALLTPRRLARSIGVRGSGASDALVRIVALRELASGIGLVARPRSSGWMWARVGGDVMDLALLGAAFAAPRGFLAPRAKQDRLATATSAVIGVAALDAWCAQTLDRRYGTAIAVRNTITINRPAEELYRYWRDFTNLPRFMEHLQSVQVAGDRRSHWKARGPAGVPLEWDAEITDDRPNELIAWRSLPGSPIEHWGVVRFERAPGGRGTQVTVGVEYLPPGGVVTAKVAKLVGEAPEQQVAENLRRFKQLVETGEISVAVA